MFISFVKTNNQKKNHNTNRGKNVYTYYLKHEGLSNYVYYRQCFLTAVSFMPWFRNLYSDGVQEVEKRACVWNRDSLWLIGLLLWWRILWILSNGQCYVKFRSKKDFGHKVTITLNVSALFKAKGRNKQLVMVWL